MARNSKRMKEMSASDKVILFSGIGVTILAVIVISLFLYSKKLNDDVKNSTMSLEDMANITNNTNGNTQSASTQLGKTVEESQNQQSENNTVNTAKTENNTNSKSNTTQNKANSSKQINNTSTSKNTANNTGNSSVTSTQNNEKKEDKKDWNFAKPVEGDIMREYAKDNLIYSETLQEWTTHTGIDIKADKTTVVKSAESGTVKSIKNDPRYGLTIVIEHDNQYQTIYSNLLTSEFVVEGEKVEKGQSIGTVGNTAAFEIADEAHLHFEIWKDSLPVDPMTLIK